MIIHRVATLAMILVLVPPGVGWVRGEPLSQRGQSEVRTVYRNKGEALTSIISPGDRDVVVLSTVPPMLRVLPPADVSLASWLARGSDAVLVITVTELEPSLTPDLDWIMTTVRARVQEVLKCSAHRVFQPGQQLAFSQEGGELDIEGKNVKAVVDWAEPFKIGHDYLVFASPDPSNGGIEIYAGNAYEIIGSSLKSLDVKQPADQIMQLPAETVFRQVKQPQQ